MALNGRQSAGSMLYNGEILDISVYPTNTGEIKIEDVKIPNMYGGKVKLSDVATVTKILAPMEIIHRDGHKMAIISLDVDGISLSAAQKKIKEAVSALELPEGYTINITGQAEETEKTVKQFVFALLLGVLLMYMIMAAEFESLIYPFVIIFTIPMGLIGVAFALGIAGTSINIVAMMGIVTLAGIVVNNGIVMVDYINQLREKGNQ